MWPGDEAILALVDTYDAVGGGPAYETIEIGSGPVTALISGGQIDAITEVGASWAKSGDWTWG